MCFVTKRFLQFAVVTFKIIVLSYTSQPGPGTAREKFDEIKSPFWTFFVKQSFFSRDLLRFLSLGYPKVRGSGSRVGRVILVLRTYLELAFEVCTKYGGDWSGSSCVKEGHRYISTNSLFIYI